LAASLVARIPDCTDPEILLAFDLRPDQLAHHDRTLTQSVARALHRRATAKAGPAGLRWWSALTGAWHTTVIFTDQERSGDVRFGTPQILRPGDAAVGAALTILGIRRRRGWL
jgi:RES domain.